MQIIIPNCMVENSRELIVQRFEVGLRIGLALFIPVSKQLILPGNYILGSNFVDLALSEIRKYFGPDDMLLGLPGTFFQPCPEVCGVNLHKCLKRHVQVPGTLLLELLLPFQCFPAGTKPSFTLLLSFSCPVRVLRNHIPRIVFFVLIGWHSILSFLLHRAFR